MKRVVALSLAALVVAGCGGDEGSAPTTAAVTVTTPVADTTIATTTPPPSSSSSTTVVATTLQATTTTVPTEDLIKQAVQDYIGAYFACGQAPATCDPSTFTANQGPSREKLTDLLEGMNREGLYFSTDLRGSYLKLESVNRSSESAALAIYCAYDALVILGPNGPDGVPTVVNDAISSSRYTYSVFAEEGAWIVGGQQQIERLGEGNLCPAA